jgi:RNA recognition motif-containing protein
MDVADRRTLFIQGIAKEASRESLWDAFFIFGEVVDITFSPDKQTALIEFTDEADASTALDNMHLSEHFGETIFVSYATKGNFADKRKPIWETP